MKEPTMTDTTPTHYRVPLDHVGAVPVTVVERGEGHPFLLLHGGGGPATVDGFAELLATSEPARVFRPSHPGFDGTDRPERLTTIRQLAALYVALLDELDLSDVTVIGNSIGGWIAAEMGLVTTNRISSIVLVDAVGIAVADHPVVDFFSLTMDQVADLSYYEPDAFRLDVSALPEAAKAVMAGNRNSLAVYGGEPSMVDPTLRERLSASTLPTLVLWGESDRIVDADYGRAYAEAIPSATFQLLAHTGHLPQIETPRQLAAVIWEFADTHATSRSNT
jgi:pimeloyl-ACP methyl ester carboxylesterase